MAPLPMHHRAFAAFADDIVAVCERHGIPVWLDDTRRDLEATLWWFVHPDLAGTATDPYRDLCDYHDEGE
ncbi:hypothetical protein D0T12_18370 [Actinomadura spongiicola]|uniref:Uncharacterized protein n=1 Tax=Actinomadura spongiicola TaxID=2303421 RepID=A0A372GFG2_9ACTN|nr:hypothetical protein [Actinomadura spongiicola]RFS84125.1 hypothetical protein D0T12_18370 [Actinomadura spongiicola]